MSAPFVTDEIVEATEAAVGAAWPFLPPGGIAANKIARAALSAAAPLWLARVQQASEHTADYQMAAGAADLLAAITPAGSADHGRCPTCEFRTPCCRERQL